jgi:6-phosphofructokinase 2
MKPIVTLTLNPTIDGSASAEVIAPVRKIRTSGEHYHPGGGGINVARVVQELGGEACALYLGGGATGAILDDLLATAGVKCRCIPIAGYTRIAHTVFERSSALEYRFVPEGPEVSEVEWESCLAELVTLDFDYVVVSGSLPRGLPETAYVRVVDIAAAMGARVVLDTSGAALKATLGKGVFLIKPNRRELEDLVGRPLPQRAEQIEAAQALIADKSAEIIAISLGSAGALIVSHAETWFAMAPPVTVHSAVGAGDSFVGAMTLAFAQGRSLNAVLAYGVAAGTAAVLSPGAELSRAPDVERLYADLLTTVHRCVAST